MGPCSSKKNNNNNCYISYSFLIKNKLFHNKNKLLILILINKHFNLVIILEKND